jgi:L-alanine-DL-glutamate epimerase-like enolase superfamily enzyme
MEVVRGFHRGWYRDVVTKPIEIVDGRAQIPDAPGLGTELLPEVRNRDDAHVRASGR